MSSLGAVSFAFALSFTPFSRTDRFCVVYSVVDTFQNKKIPLFMTGIEKGRVRRCRGGVRGGKRGHRKRGARVAQEVQDDSFGSE